MAISKLQLEAVVNSPFSTPEQVVQAKNALAEMDATRVKATPVAPRQIVAAKPAPVQKARHYMDWIPDLSPEGTASMNAMLAKIREEATLPEKTTN